MRSSCLKECETLPETKYIFYAMMLGFIAYGMSIFMYIKAQRNLGAAKTSAYYAVAPFIGAFLSFIVNGESLTIVYFVALIIMMIGTSFVVYDTLVRKHLHPHSHIIVHTHGGKTHSHSITHTHEHNHFLHEERHGHRHEGYMNSKEHQIAHNIMGTGGSKE